MKSVAILLNPGKPRAVALGCELVAWLEQHEVLVMIESSGAAALDMNSYARDDDALAVADFAIVMGGDGTLLRASRLLAPAGVPMIAVRFGQFGFMTDTEPSELFHVLGHVLDGKYHIEERMMLRAQVHHGENLAVTPIALNDIVIGKGPLARMLHLETHVSGRYISTYAADGLIVSTPTGSTAYSLSAGGPIVTPDLNVLIITPICPHTLTARSLIISGEEVVEVVVGSRRDDLIMLTVDGQLGIPLTPGDKVSISKSEVKTKLIMTHGTTFYSKLQSRLKWGDRFDTPTVKPSE